MLSTRATFAPLKRKVFLEDLPFLGMGKAETGKNFARIILSLLFSTILLGYKENGKNWDHWVGTL